MMSYSVLVVLTFSSTLSTMAEGAMYSVLLRSSSVAAT